MLNKIDNGVKSNTAVVLLHGFGADENDLFDLQYLFKGAHVISYQAPIDLTPYGYFGGRAWFPLEFTPYGIEYNEDEVRKAIAIITEELKALMPNFGKLYLCGFSQGAILTHAVFLNSEIEVDGIAGLSGRFNKEIFKSDLVDNIAGKPVFLSHGTVDEVIPIQSGREIREFYAGSSADLTAAEYEMGHGIDPECQRDLMNWYNGLK